MTNELLVKKRMSAFRFRPDFREKLERVARALHRTRTGAIEILVEEKSREMADRKHRR